MSCPACGERALAPWRAARSSDGRLSARPEYELARCRSCGTAALAPGVREEELGALYAEGTYAEGDGRLGGALGLVRSLADRDRMRLLGHLAPGARVFEAGAGDGRFLARLAAAGLEVAGIEPSPPYAERARARGVAVEAVELEDASVAPASQDVVVLWHVLEHLDEPFEALGRIRGWLAPGGTLLVGVPNLASLQARIGGDRWFHQDVPRHRTHFTERGLLALLGRAGFGSERVAHLLVEHNAFGMWQTLVNRLTREPDALYRFVKSAGGRREGARDALVTALAGPPLVPVALGLELAAGAARRGGTIAVVARRG